MGFRPSPRLRTRGDELPSWAPIGRSFVFKGYFRMVRISFKPARFATVIHSR
jgi:hypothetical protein